VDLDSYHPWFLGLSVGGAAAIAAFTVAKRSTELSVQRRRLLFALAAIIALATAIAVGLTGIFFVLFSGYCEDVDYCAPKWWVFVGFVLLGVAIVLGGLMGRAIGEYRRVA
jgi:protein-S-isoprenylcysteine O-methyltransferase Ste14